MFGLDAMVGNVSNERGTSISGRGNIVLHDPYQDSKLMRSRKDLRLKRGAARAMDRRTGVQNYEGPQASRLVIHIGSKTRGEEVCE